MPLPGVETQDPLGEVAAPQPAPPQAQPGLAPGMGVIAPGIPAAQILGGGSAPDLARMAAAQMPIPDSEEYRLAKQKSADAWASYLKTGEDQKKAFDAQKQETDLAAQQYAERAKSMLPQPMAAAPAPSRGLRPFLASTANEDPYTTLSKFMQSVTLLATMMGGGRDGARASVSALTGAIEGWTKGDRYQADAAYQTWKDTTDAMFRQFDDEMRAYNSLMIAERVPLEQKLRALETTAWDHKNTMAQKAFEVGKADQAVAHLDQMRQAGVKAMMDAAAIQGSYEKAQQQQAQFEARLNQQVDQFKQQLAAKEAELNFRMKLQELGFNQKLALAGMKADNPGAKPTDRQSKNIEDGFQTATVLNRLDELAGKVDLRKLVGGINPWKNNLIQKWGQANSPAPAEGTTSGPIKVSGALTDDEQQFLALLKDYADSILRQRSGAAISQYELTNLLQFVPDPMHSPATVRSRLAMAQQRNLATMTNQINVMKAMGYRTPDLSALQPARIGGGAQSAANPYNLTKQGSEWVSPDGKYVWRNGAWAAK